jgi:hypothetical protein
MDPRRDIMSDMPATKRSTIYFEPKIHQAVRRKAAAVDASISEIVNEAVKLSLIEDAEDLKEFERRRQEPTVPFAQAVRSIKRRG